MQRLESDLNKSWHWSRTERAWPQLQDSYIFRQTSSLAGNIQGLFAMISSLVWCTVRVHPHSKTIETALNLHKLTMFHQHKCLYIFRHFNKP